MELPDTRLYMCTKCFRRCLWDELSDKEHRCIRCRLQSKECSYCNNIFEPLEESNEYCKRCTFYIERHGAVRPPPIPNNRRAPEGVEQNREGSSITERWSEIRAASGIEDDSFSD
ncbi:hypothetical protein KR084_011839 [Drosophila pseudotakahashii]|nr:hypothetical protein KR084_011839 [Drosophila pseudotakahashii]